MQLLAASATDTCGGRTLDVCWITSRVYGSGFRVQDFGV